MSTLLSSLLNFILVEGGERGEAPVMLTHVAAKRRRRNLFPEEIFSFYGHFLSKRNPTSTACGAAGDDAELRRRFPSAGDEVELAV